MLCRSFMICLLCRMRGGQRPAKTSSTANKAEPETCDSKHDKDNENNFRNAGSTRGNAAKTKQCGNQGNHEEHDCIAKHGEPSLMKLRPADAGCSAMPRIDAERRATILRDLYGTTEILNPLLGSASVRQRTCCDSTYLRRVRRASEGKSSPFADTRTSCDACRCRLVVVRAHPISDVTTRGYQPWIWLYSPSEALQTRWRGCRRASVRLLHGRSKHPSASLA